MWRSPSIEKKHENKSGIARHRKKRLSRELKRCLGNRLFVVGLLILVPIFLMSLLAPLITSYDPLELNLPQQLTAPNREHPLGTDMFGRDVLSRVIYGSRISLRVGALTALSSSLFGLIIGSVAGYYGTLDSVLMRLMDGFMAFPGLLLALVIVASIGRSEFNVVIAMTIIYTPRIARVVRGAVLEIKEEDYIDAARVVGLSKPSILSLHILPSCLSPLIVQATFGFAWAILVEASLSFVGLGTPPPAPSWGSIISDGREFIRAAPWIVISPGLAISAAVLGLNMLGDGLRDLLDPKLMHVRK